MRITDSILESFAMADAVIDFTTPKATVEHAKYAAQARPAHVIGTTGFNKNQLLKIKYAAQHANNNKIWKYESWSQSYRGPNKNSFFKT